MNFISVITQTELLLIGWPSWAARWVTALQPYMVMKCLYRCSDCKSQRVGTDYDLIHSLPQFIQDALPCE